MSLPSEHDSLDLHDLGAADAGAPPEAFLGRVRQKRRDAVRVRVLGGVAACALLVAVAVVMRPGNPLGTTERTPIVAGGDAPTDEMGTTTLASLRQNWSSAGSLPLADAAATRPARSFRVQDVDLLLDGGL